MSCLGQTNYQVKGKAKWTDWDERMKQQRHGFREYSKAPALRVLSVAIAMLLIALVLAQPCLSQTSSNGSEEQKSIWDQEFSRKPQWLLHATGHGTYYGGVKDDWLFLFTAPPTEDGFVELPDGSGGTFTYAIDYSSGPYNTPREVCAACDSKIGNGSMTAWWNGITFSCMEMNAKPGSEKQKAEKTYSILGTKFNDSNGNGIKDTGEEGLAGWSIRLVRSDGYDTATTGSDGSYKFSDLKPGNYKINEVQQKGWNQTFPATGGYDISLKDKDVSGQDFGNWAGIDEPHILSGVVFNDKNGDGQENGNESGVEGWTVKLTKPDGTTETATTESDGSYKFENIKPGDYQLSEESRNGWEKIVPESEYIQVKLRALDISDQNFGNRGTLSISGMLFNDTNGNGTKDEGEEGLGKITLKLIRPDGSEDAYETKDDGSFEFNHLEPGDYRLTIDEPDGWIITMPKEGFVDIPLSKSDFKDVLLGMQSSTAKKFKIYGTVFNDRNRDGKIMKGLGLGGWDVELKRPDGSTLVTTSASNGEYEFNSLSPGKYKVTAVKKKGWKEYSANPVPVDFKDADHKVDIGFIGDLTISGVKYNDTNGDGSWDRRTLGGLLPEELSNEPGLFDWRIKIKGPGGESGTSTEPSGWYEFDELEPGEYTLTEEQQQGWVQTAPKSVSYKVTIKDDDRDDLDFGNRGALSINGTKFNDRNGNGIKDVDEPGIENWQIILTRPGGIQETASTDQNGGYKFEHLEPGEYKVEESPMTGWAQTYPNGGAAHKFTLTTNNAKNVDFGNQGIREISGTKYYDKNNNGILDPDDERLDNWNIQLEAPDGKVLAKTTTSDGTNSRRGTYSFTKLAPGKYVVREEVKSGWKPVDPNNGVHTVDLDPSIDSDNIDFINAGSLSISGVKFNDSNGDGFRDYTEQGLGNWTIILEQPEGTKIAQTVTKEDGSYRFESLVPGIYYLREVRKPYWNPTAPRVNPTQEVILTDRDNSSVDFGNRIELPGGGRKYTISGVKFYDLNGDGIQNGNEPALPDFTIRLTMPDGTTRDTTTSSDGSYWFKDLDPGRYLIAEAPPIGWLQTTGGGFFDVVDGSITNVDFGNNGALVITGIKFDDINGNGTLDPGEQGLPGWDIYLQFPAFNTLASTTTRAGGVYSFNNLGPGTYYVMENIQRQNGWKQTAGPYKLDITVENGGAFGVNFGNQGIRKISGVKFYDRNNNGVMDSGERGLPGWTINLERPLETVIRTTTTGRDGSYKFENLEPWTFWLSEVRQPGWSQITPSPLPPTNGIVAVNLTEGDATSINFGNRGTLSISGTKFNDRNGNRIREPSEEGLGGWFIDLIDGSSGQLLERNITSPDGSYSFVNQTPGTYIVRERQKSGWRQTAPKGRSWNVTLTTRDAAGMDFGNQGALSINGTKFNDTNGNGVQDMGEKGLSGWTIVLEQAGQVLKNNITNASGAYIFANLPPGVYNLSEKPKIGWSQTAPRKSGENNAGNVGAIATADTNSGNYTKVLQGFNAIGVDFGNRGALSINGTEFNDANGNGVWDVDENGMAGWIINLEQPIGKVVANTTSDDHGSYIFDHLAPGSYFVRQVSKPGWNLTAPKVQPLSINLVSHNISGVDFGNRGIRSISGTKFNDSNGNGIKDTNEKGLAGWTIHLVAENSTLKATNITGPSGAYRFDHLPSGSYRLSEIPQHGWNQTLPVKGIYHVNITSSNVSGKDFGNRWALSINGTEFNDTNGNGVWDVDETGMAGWTIQLERPAGKTIATNTTDKDGRYIFLYLTPGNYTIREMLKPGWNQTAPKEGQYSFNLAAKSIRSVDFGVQRIE